MSRAAPVLLAALLSAGVTVEAGADESGLEVRSAAGAWSGIDAASIATWLPAGRWAVLVVTVNAAHPEAARAQLSVSAALRGGGRTTLVIDDGVLGDVSLLDDAHVLARASRLPVELVAILRLADGPGGTVLRGALYDRRTAAVLSELTARAGGAPFISAPGARTPDDDVPAKPVVPAPAPPPPPGVGPAAPPLPPELVARLILFGRPAPEEFDASIDAWDPMQGMVNGRRLRGAAFYEAIERPDLAAEYRDRASRQMKILVPGICIAGAGLITMQLATSFAGTEWWKYAIAGGGLLVTGGAVALGSLAIHRSPVPGRRAVRMARDFNRRLEQRFGVQLDAGAREDEELPPDAMRQSPGAIEGVRVVIGPAPLPSGGGLMVVGEF